SAWLSRPTSRPPVRATRPVSGSWAPARTRSRVDLPPPLRPTTPMRSPSSRPSETPSRTTWVPTVTLARSTLIRAVISPGARRVRAPGRHDVGARHRAHGPLDLALRAAGGQPHRHVDRLGRGVDEEGDGRPRAGDDGSTD